MSQFVAIGVGCRRGVAGETIAALARRALEAVARGPDGLLLEEAGAGVRSAATRLAHIRFFTLADKTREPGLIEAARLLAVPLVGLPRKALVREALRILTPSAAAQARHGVPNVAEAAALAGAGPGGKLLGPRLASDGVTCAVALSAEAP